MSAPWFHVGRIPAVGDDVLLDRDEAKHALGVRRLGPGDSVTVFDGAGGIARAVLSGDRARDGGIVARVADSIRAARPGTDVVVGVAPPKGDRFPTLLDMLGQLGVRAVVPLAASRGVVDAKEINRPRAERILLEACKQSRSAWVPELRPAASVEEFVRAARGEGRTVLVADAGGAGVPAGLPGGIAIVVGPEGGLSAEERAAALAAGAATLGLGPGILRVETAAVAAASLFRARPVPGASRGLPEWSAPGSNR